MKPVLHVLTGPTAVGKTEWALRWAEAEGAEILSGDSLLFYRGMDIGTAKPTAAERARVPHHLIDTNAVTDPMDIAHYAIEARRVAGEIAGRGRGVLVTGGSGFYLKSFFGPVVDDVKVPPELRASVSSRYERHGLTALVNELRGMNPDGLGELDTDNPIRVMRALERCLATGRTLAVLKANFLGRPGPFADWEVRVTCLTRPADELKTRIEVRVEGMVRAGLVEEVRRLKAEGLERNPSAARAIGYRETLALLDGRLDEANLIAEISKNTWALVRKQRTWFRTQLPEHRVVAAGDAGARLFVEDQRRDTEPAATTGARRKPAGTETDL